MNTAKIETTVGDLISAVFEAATETTTSSEEASALTKMVVDALIARSKSETVRH